MVDRTLENYARTFFNFGNFRDFWEKNDDDN